MTQHDPKRIHWQWLDRVVALDLERGQLTAERDFGVEEWYLEHHYPGFPVVPGVFLIEAMAHALAVLRGTLHYRATGSWQAYVLAMTHEARFYTFVQPGESATIDATLTSLNSAAGAVEGRALVRVGDRKIARARLTLHPLDAEALGTRAAGAPLDDPFRLGAYVRMLLTPALQSTLAQHEGPPQGDLHG